MYQVNDTVIYGTNGICKIIDITDKDFSGVQKEYYILKPFSNMNSTIYVPLNNELLVKKMRRVLSAEEIYNIIHSMPTEEMIWIEDENERKAQYKQIISQGDRIKLVKMIKALYQHQQELQMKGKKLHVSDERFFKEAENLLYDEFAVVLKIDSKDVLPFILSNVNTDEKLLTTP